jgi:hypothetical protein
LLPGIEYLFLVGGFAESAMLQADVRKEFGQQVKIVIPQEASLAILKGRNKVHFVILILHVSFQWCIRL